jgi:PIN domain nuclease of toxin-antitoxin system
MNVLPDTHTILWDFLGDPRLGEASKQILFSRESSIRVSAVSIWEIAMKVSLGKLSLGRPIEEFMERVARHLHFRHLPMTAAHAVAVSRLPFHHKDPFDRMLIAQAQFEGLTIVTADEEFSKYDVPVLDARR